MARGLSSQDKVDKLLLDPSLEKESKLVELRTLPQFPLTIQEGKVVEEVEDFDPSSAQWARCKCTFMIY